MNYKVVFTLVLLMFVFLLGVFFLKSGDILIAVKKELINQLEQSYRVKLDVADATFWPLDQLVLKELKITSSDGEIYFSAPLVKIYYDFIDIVLRRRDPLKSINYIKIEKPLLRVSTLNLKDKFKQELITGISSLGIEVIDGNLFLLEDGRKADLNSFSFLLKLQDKEDGKLSLKTGVNIKELKLRDRFVRNLSIDQVELGMTYSREGWQGSLETSFFALDNLLSLLETAGLLQNTPLKVSEMKGSGKLALNFSGEGLELNNYSGSLVLKEGSALLTVDNYIDPEELTNLEGKFLFNSRERMLFIRGLKFEFAENPYRFEGSLRFGDQGLPEIFGHLNSDSLELSHTGLKLNAFGLTGLANLDLTLSGVLNNPEIEFALSLDRGKIDEQTVSNMKADLRYRNGYLYVDSLDLKLNQDNLLTLKGVFNSRSAEYSFAMQGSNLQIALLQKCLDNELLGMLKGRINSGLILTGKGMDLANLSLSGNLELLSPEINGTKLESLQTDFWLTDNKLLLHGGAGLAGESEVLFSGELDLNDNSLALKLSGEGIDLGLFNRIMGNKLAKLTGAASFSGSLSGKLDEPLLEMDLTVPTGSLVGYTFNNLKTRVTYRNKDLQIKKLTAEVAGSHLQGRGLLELTDIYPYLKAELKVENCRYASLEEQLGQPLPLEGILTADLELKGPLTEPEIKGSISSSDTVLTVSGRNYALDELNLTFNWQKKEGISLKNLKVLMGEASLTAEGKMRNRELNFTYALNNLALSQLPLKENLELKGSLDLTGEVKGRLNQPEVSGTITAGDIEYRGQKLDGFTGNYYFGEDRLDLQDIVWQIGDNRYFIAGQIENLTADLTFDLNLETKQGEIEDLPLARFNFPLPQGYYFQGRINLKGNREEPYVMVDLSFFDQINNDPLRKADSFYLKGKIGQQFDLTLEGNKVAVSRLPLLKEKDIKLEGSLDFQGKLTGRLDSYDLQLTTDLVEGRINNVAINRIRGEVEVTDAKRLYIKQEMVLSNSSSLNVSGYIPFNEGKENFDLVMDLTDLPLSLISTIFTNIPALRGYVDGSVAIKGSPDNPSLDGRLFLVGGEIDLELPARLFVLKGELDLSGQTVRIAKVTGKYGDGDLTIRGRINPFNQDSIWDLEIAGKDLPFNYGSFAGRIDPEIRITGSLYKPLIKGEVLTHDLIVGLPFSWPVGDDRESYFNPDLDFTFYPGEDVYLRNKHIDVLIQDGSLNLSYKDKELTLDGMLKSEQGSFDYYSNKFMLTEAEADFNKFTGLIPDLDVKAWTRVSGTRIEVRLQGPANNMITSFSSQPPLSEDEILTLLASRGGLGAFVSGDWTEIIRKELMRIFADKIQLDIVSDIEKKVKKSLSLDRLEIDTYNLGWDREITIYLGKYLNERTYLQYSRTLTSEEEDFELALRYYLNDNLLFEGSWQGEDDYRLSLETNIEF